MYKRQSGYSATTITKTITVQNVGGANKYFIDGVQQQTQELFERNTYRFDQSDSSNSGHPFRFSTTSNGSHAGGSEYTTGVTVNGTPGQAGAYTEITVPEFTPTLYYYCTQHSGMGGTANTPFVYNILPTTNASVTGVVGTSALGTVITENTALISPTGTSATVSISGYSATTITKTVIVQNVSGANKYFIDGVQQQTQELFERNTYRFDQSDSSNSNHPLRFSTTPNGSHSGGSEYTTGVTVNGTPGQAGAYTEITVSEFAPTLYLSLIHI